MAEFNSHSQCQIHSRKEVRKSEIKTFPSPQSPSPSLRRSVCNYTVGMWDCGTMSRPPQKMNPSCLNSLSGDNISAAHRHRTRGEDPSLRDLECTSSLPYRDLRTWPGHRIQMGTRDHQLHQVWKQQQWSGEGVGTPKLGL